MVDQDVIFASETVGVTTSEVYMPCYLVGYRMSLDAVENCAMRGQSGYSSPMWDPDTGGRRDSAASGIKEGRIFHRPGMGLSGSGIETDKR